MEEYIEERKIIAEIAHKAGRSSAYTQGAGGNVSVKTPDGKMIIKASGFRLKDVTPENGLACVMLDPIAKMLEHKEISADLFGNAVSSSHIPLCGTFANPSVETGFHSMLQKYVIHHHSVYANFISCCASGKKMAMELFPGSRFIPFCPPGMELCLAIRKSLDECPLRAGKTEIFFFANHGLAVSADSAEDSLMAMDYVNSRIKKHYSLSDFDISMFCEKEIFGIKGCLTLDQMLYFPDINKKPSSQTEKEIICAAGWLHSEYRNKGLLPAHKYKC